MTPLHALAITWKSLGDTKFKNAPIYGLHVDFKSTDGPLIYMASYEYKNIKSWDGSMPSDSHWQFYWPLHSNLKFNITGSGHGPFVSEPKNETHKELYWNLERATWMTKELVGITQEKVPALIETWKEL